jgi:hypothetical protein
MSILGNPISISRLARRRIEEQKVRLADLVRDGHPTGDATELLRQFQETLPDGKSLRHDFARDQQGGPQI